MAAIPVTENYRYIQYTGSNSSELNAELAMTIISETGGVLVAEIPVGGPEKTISTGQYVIYLENEVREIDDNAEFTRRWKCVLLCDDLEDVSNAVEELASDFETLSGQVAALESLPAIRSMGVAPVPLLIASASTTVGVTLSPAMPDSSYTARAMLFAGVNIASLSINSVTVVDNDTVNVVVQNTGLVSLSGSNVLVTASA